MPKTLGELRPWLTHLEPDCTRCPRRGRLNLERLIARHGEGMTLRELQALLPGDCPNRGERDVDRCAVGYPQLVEIARALYGPDLVAAAARWRSGSR